MLKNLIFSIIPKRRLLIVLFILPIANTSMYSQSKKEYLAAVNEKINYQLPYQKMQGSLIYESVLDEYKFVSVFEVTGQKTSTICKNFTKYDVENISMHKNNLFSIQLSTDKCTQVTETNSGSEVMPMHGIIFMLDEESMSLYQAQKYLDALKFIFDK